MVEALQREGVGGRGVGRECGDGRVRVGGQAELRWARRPGPGAIPGHNISAIFRPPLEKAKKRKILETYCKYCRNIAEILRKYCGNIAEILQKFFTFRKGPQQHCAIHTLRTLCRAR